MEELLDVLHIYLGNYYRSLRKSSIYYFKSIFLGVIYIFKNIAYFFYFSNKSIVGKETTQQKIWLICSSLNNYNSLKFLKDSIEDTVFLTTNTSSWKSDLKDMNRISFHKNLLNLFTFPQHFFHLLKKHGFFCFKVIDAILEGGGMVNTCKKILQEQEPKALVFSNDHTIKNRGLLLAAKQLNIPTIYIQHASVTMNFPPLKFDLSLLEGKDTLVKYKNIANIEGKVSLVGMPKFDGYEKFRNTSKDIKRVGICSKIIDAEKDIIQLLHFVKKKFPDLILTYRPHPRDARKSNFPKDVLISNSKKEMIFDFLKNQDLVIAGDTSLHLEATMLNVQSIYFDITVNEGFLDAYGYVKNELVPKAENLDMLTTILARKQEHKQDIWKKASYYNATIGTVNDGKSQQLVIKEILDFL